MLTDPRQTIRRPPAIEAHLLGTVEFDDCLTLQQRLVYETAGRTDRQITLLLCEHPLKITVGRLGSRSHIHLSRHELISRQIEVRWVNRGGGCLVHAPGQLAIYPVVPLDRSSLTVGDYLERLQRGLSDALAELHCQVHSLPGRFGLWAQSGQVVAVGAAVKNWVSYFGAYLNVSPALYPFRWVESDPSDQTRMTSLSADRRRPVRMATVREAVVRHLSAAFECQRYHIYSGHPLLRQTRGGGHAPAARVG